MKFNSKLVKFGITLVLLISFFTITANKASAQMVNDVRGQTTVLPGEDLLLPPDPYWLYPSTTGGYTDLTFTVYSATSYESGDFMVYLQRCYDGTHWTTVAHAGFPRNASKSVTFTREYNNPSLYPTTPYRFMVSNKGSYIITLDFRAE